MKKETLQKLEEVLVAGCEAAIASGHTIVYGVYHPYEDAYCPIYAACKAERDAVKGQPHNRIPCYQEIISEKIGERFTDGYLHSWLNGFDQDNSFDSHYHTHPNEDEDVFDLGRKLRHKYIVSRIDVSEHEESKVECLSETQVQRYLKTMIMPSKVISHIDWCSVCRDKLELALDTKNKLPIPSSGKDRRGDNRGFFGRIKSWFSR